MKICIAVLIGLPASGKTTFSKLACSYSKTDCCRFNVIHINYDDILTIDPECKMHDKPRKCIANCVEYIVKCFQSVDLFILNEYEKYVIHKIKWNNSDSDVLILIDDNMYYRSMRYDYFKLCKELAIQYCQIYIYVNLDIALERNSKRENLNKIPNEIIERMNIRLQKPNIKNVWEQNSITLHAGDSCFNVDTVRIIIDFVNKIKNIPVKKTYITKVNISQSNLHQIDLLLRKNIGSLVQKEIGKNENNIALLSSELNAKRKEILIDMKKGLLTLDEKETFEDFIKLHF